MMHDEPLSRWVPLPAGLRQTMPETNPNLTTSFLKRPVCVRFMSRVTIRDVAKKAGVGVGTVSRVLNNSPQVSEETYQRVTAAIRELDYRPSSVARQLSLGGRTLAVGIIVPFFTRPAFMGRLQGVEAALTQTKYDLILYNVETPEQRDRLFRHVPQEGRVDGLLSIALVPPRAVIDYCRNVELPLVLVDADHPELPSIRMDDFGGAHQAISYLIELGHRKIAFVSDIIETDFGSFATKRRFAGYRAALEEHGIPFREEFVKQGEYSRLTAFNLTSDLLKQPDLPTAIFATSDTLALGVIEAIRSAGLRVPRDISVVGYDDIDIATSFNLTTIHQPLYQSGVEGVEALLQLLDNGLQSSTVTSYTLPVHLVIRETTSPPSVS
jgi:LacI family transcriptional regulator